MISTTISSSACVVIAILDVAYRSTLALQPTAYQARAVAKEIRQMKFEDENTPFQEELLIRLVNPMCKFFKQPSDPLEAEEPDLAH